jgi:aromatic ring-cleaving dioxygenase
LEEKKGLMADQKQNGAAVKRFPEPIRSYDVHIYFWQTDAADTEKARALREEIQQKFPQFKLYKFWDTPIGPHPTGMFEVDLQSPDEFATFVPWIQVNRRGLSVLVHPNTGRPRDDHTVNAIWIGEKQSLNTSKLANEDDKYGYGY